MRDLNRVYRAKGALHQRDVDPGSFEWVDLADADASVLSFLRRGRDPEDVVLVACNFTPVPRWGYRLGAPRAAYYRELINTDAREYGGSRLGNRGGMHTEPVAWHGRPASLVVEPPPLGVVYFKPDRAGADQPRETGLSLTS